VTILPTLEAPADRPGPRDAPRPVVVREGSPDRFPLEARLRWLRRFERAIRDAMDEWCGLVATETGKPPFETIASDLLPLLACVAWHRRHARGLLRPRRLSGRPLWLLGTRHELRREPLGRVGIIATWNYPIQLLGIQLVQAIVAGNRVTVKPSERSPRVQARLVALAVEAGLPDGWIELRPADRSEGARLVADPSIDHLVFTGSTAVGTEIARAAAARLLPTTLELSGRDSALVLADADAGLAARTVWNAVAMNAGQTCMAPRRVLVVGARYREFLAALAPLVAAAPPVTLVDAAAAKATFAAVADALARGGRPLAGAVEPPAGRAMRPVAVVDAPRAGPLWDGDHFGPALAVVPVADLDEAIALHRSIGQALATSVYTRDTAAVGDLAGRLGSSFVTVNDTVVPTAHPAASLGGLGPSGWGVSRGAAGLLALTREVTVSVTGRFFRPPAGPPTPSAIMALRRLVSFPRSPGPDPNAASNLPANPPAKPPANPPATP